MFVSTIDTRPTVIENFACVSRRMICEPLIVCKVADCGNVCVLTCANYNSVSVNTRRCVSPRMVSLRYELL